MVKSIRLMVNSISISISGELATLESFLVEFHFMKVTFREHNMLEPLVFSMFKLQESRAREEPPATDLIPCGEV